MDIQLKDLLMRAYEAGASDIHLVAGAPPRLRVHTSMVSLEDFPIPGAPDVERFVVEMAGEQSMAELRRRRDIDFSTQLGSAVRFRVNAHFQLDTVALAFHAIPEAIPSLEDLNLPPVIKKFLDLPQGLVLVTGQTGDGKSTTLAAMVQHINEKHSYHIVTLEDPIEHVFRSNKSLIEQRELGRDVFSFADGLRSALRQDPDVIMVGEMRDTDTTMATITAAETGHLVLSCMHTQSPSQTVERIIDIYPGPEQNQVRAVLANTLQAVISQRLLRRIDSHGAIAAYSVMICTPAIRNCIRDGRIHEIPSIMQTSREMGMCMFEESVADLCERGCISRQEAAVYSSRFPKMTPLPARMR